MRPQLSVNSDLNITDLNRASVLDLEALIEPYLLRHWQRYQAFRQPDFGHSQEVPSILATPEVIYAKLTSYRFCRRRPGDRDGFLQVLALAMQSNEPIPVILGHGPLKNRNNCEHSTVDWAEFFTLSHLLFLNEQIRKLYPPGLSVTLFLDDARAEEANQIPRAWTESYRNSLCQLVKQAGIADFIPQVVSLRELYDVYQVWDHLEVARSSVSDWEADPQNAEGCLVHLMHAQKNLPEAASLSQEEQERLCREAAHRYRVYYQAEQLAGLWSIPNKLYGRFTGHDGFWQLFTVRKGSVSQPWQGQGCLHLTDAVKLEPFVMTRSKASQYQQHLLKVPTGLPWTHIPLVMDCASPLQ